MSPTTLLAMIWLAQVVIARAQDSSVLFRKDIPAAYSPVLKLEQPSNSIFDSSTIPPSIPPFTTSSPTQLDQTLAPSAAVIMTSGTTYSATPSAPVTNSTTTQLTTLTSTLDAAVAAGPTLTSSAPDNTTSSTTISLASSASAVITSSSRIPLSAAPDAVTALSTIPAPLAPSSIATAKSSLPPTFPLSTETKPLPSGLNPLSSAPALTRPSAPYYPNSSGIVVVAANSTSASFGGFGGVSTSAYGSAAAPTAAKGAGVGGAGGGATPAESTGAGTKVRGPWVGLVVGVLGAVLGGMKWI